MAISQKALNQAILMSNDVILRKIMAGAGYGAKAFIYGPSSIADLELSSSQCLLLGLLHAIVTEEIMSCCMLAEVCFQDKHLQSDHLRIWLARDFIFPRKDMEKAMVLLEKLLTSGVLKMPPHVIRIMSFLAAKYGVKNLYLKSTSQEHHGDLAIQLENAVINNSPGDIITLASEGGDINGQTQSGESLIHLAARTDSYAAISALGYLRADLEIVNSSNATPLEEAIKNNCVRSIKALLLAGANVNKRMFRGDTYLHIAAAYGQNEALETLLEAGIEKNEINYLGETPLFCAVKAGNTVGIEVLLHRGADASIIPKGSKTFLDMIMVQNIDKLKEFIKYRTLLDLKTEDGDTILHLVARSGNAEKFKVFIALKKLADCKNQNGETPLHAASDVSIVRMLIGMGVNLNSQDNNGSTPLMFASKNSRAEIVRLLLYNGASPKIKDNASRTALHYAAEGGCTESVTVLLDSGGEVDEKDNSHKTPSLLAVVNNRVNVIHLLARRGADLTLRDPNECGLLHHAVYSNHVEMVTALLDVGVDINMKGPTQRTALSCAAEKGHAPLVKLLLDRGADIEGKSDYQSTSLMWAAQEGHLDVVKLLIERGAGVNESTTDYGKGSALNYAVSEGHKEIADYLISKGATSS